MKTKIVEVTNGSNNWGKFLLGIFDDQELKYRSIVAEGRPLLRTIGWQTIRPAVWILDLQTKEGGAFHIGGCVKADLDKHRIWVCPLFEPFLEWLYKQKVDDVYALQLPAHVDLPDAEFQWRGYRRPGPEAQTKDKKETA